MIFAFKALVIGTVFLVGTIIKEVIVKKPDKIAKMAIKSK
jgi:hypothetical protein